MSEKFNFKQRIKGGLEGLVCGDVYGNMTVGYTKDLVIVNYGKPPLKLRLPIPASSLRTTWGLGEVTDDTIQAFTVAKNLIENKKIVINKLFVELKNLPEKFAKSGSSTGKLKLIKNHYCKSFSITNGAAMRVAPIGMAFSIKKKELLLKEVVKASAMTHNSKSSIAGAVAIAFAISAIIDGKSMDEVISLAIEGAILGENYGLKDGLKSMSMEIKKCLNVGYNTYRKDSFSNPDWGFAAIESIPYSIGLLNEFWDCRKAITKAVQYGGDSDTICSIAGALCGTFRPDSVPEEILKCIKSNPFENFLESLYYLRGNQKMLKNNFQTKIQYFNVSISVSTNNHQLNKKILQYSKLFDPISKKCNDNWKLGAMVTKQYKQYIPKSNVFEYELEHKEKCNASYKGNNLCIWNKDFLIIKKRKSIKIYTFSIKKMEDLVSKIVRQIFSYSPNMPYSMKIHASACSIQNIGIMFIGVKGAGKTTSLLSILDNIDAHYIGNDIIEARQFENKILLNGWPAACLIGKGTLENINKYRYLLSSNLNKKQFPKVLISFSQIEKLLKTRIVRHIQLKYVFFPILNLNKVHSSIIKLRPSKSFVKENMFCLEDEHPDWLNINPKKELYQSINEIKSWRELKFFKIQLGSSSSLASKKIYNLIRKDVK